MPEIWVTPRACSMCRSHHDEDDDYGDSCDCWCHDAGASAEDWDLG